MSIYAVADLHGQYGVFERGLKSINFSDADFLYVIGDAIDRGPDSIKILQHIMNAPNMELLLGNHEHLMLTSVEPDGEDICTGENTELWIDNNGGDKTFYDYTELPIEERKQMLAWLNTRSLIKVIDIQKKNYVLTHSFYIPGYNGVPFNEIPKDDAENIVWKSMYRHDRETRCGNIYKNYPECTFIIGHVPVQNVTRQLCAQSYKNGNSIDIDGGLAGRDPLIHSSAIFYNLTNGNETIEPLLEQDLSDEEKAILQVRHALLF